MSTLAKRLREARMRAWISLERLAIQIGMEPASARVRLGRYERGERIPEPNTVERIANHLGLPEAYFYASDDGVAELLLWFSRLEQEEREKLLDKVRQDNALIEAPERKTRVYARRGRTR
jgi:transcriptional regulator with XRE-family HTH domain